MSNSKEYEKETAERVKNIRALCGKSLISISDLSKEEIETILFTAKAIKDQMKECPRELEDLLKGIIISNFFYEPSTRTDHSFQNAAYRMGANVIATSHAKVFSSAAKGESLADSVRVESMYCDLLVLRHFDKGSAEIARNASQVPVINAGDGTGEHPTQALLDLFTIKEIMSEKIDGLSIGMMGDLKNGRTIHSLIKLLNLYNNVTVYLNSSDELKLPEEHKKYASNLNLQEVVSIDEVIDKIDVLYVTRIQLEHFKGEEKKDFILADEYKINLKRISQNPKLKIMHPLPRVDEINTDIDNTSHEYYFKQADNGKYVRMALLVIILGRLFPENIGDQILLT